IKFPGCLDHIDSSKLEGVSLFSPLNLNEAFLKDKHKELPRENPTVPEDPLQWPAYFQMKFTQGDFQYDQYFNALNREAQVLSVANIIYAGTKPVDPSQAPKPVIIHPPYTPELRALTIDYTATDDKPSEVHQSDSSDTLSLLPVTTLIKKDEGTGDQPIKLLLKISEAIPGQTISLLFELESLSALPLNPIVAFSNPQQGIQATLRWEYKNSAKQWEPLSFSEDSCNALQNSGTLVFAVPTDKYEQENTLWICASISSALNLPKVLNIACQGVQVNYCPIENGQAPSAPLPANTITASLEAVPVIKTIKQSCPSFGGRASETEDGMKLRASQHLRHRNRALSRTDYERLVLEQFPEIAWVKCMTPTIDNGVKPGELLLLVMPRAIRKQEGMPSKLLFADQVLLNNIERYLRGLCSAHIGISVRNPHYSPITYDITVEFEPGLDKSHCQQQLDLDLISILTPWLDEQETAPPLGIVPTCMEVADKVVQKNYIATIKTLVIHGTETLAAPTQARTLFVSEFYSYYKGATYLVTAKDEEDEYTDAFRADRIFNSIQAVLENADYDGSAIYVISKDGFWREYLNIEKNAVIIFAPNTTLVQPSAHEATRNALIVIKGTAATKITVDIKGNINGGNENDLNPVTRWPVLGGFNYLDRIERKLKEKKRVSGIYGKDAQIKFEGDISFCCQYKDEGLKGGGVYLYDCTADFTGNIKNCGVWSKTLTASGGGVSFESSTVMIKGGIKGCFAVGKTETYGGGVSGNGGTSNFRLSGNIADCVARSIDNVAGGGGVCLSDGGGTIYGDILSCLANSKSSTDKKAARGGGIYILLSSETQAKNNF
ncbi:MAG: hypothetical protein R8K20_07645, partial [Gallionellaceae bacterium]